MDHKDHDDCPICKSMGLDMTRVDFLWGLFLEQAKMERERMRECRKRGRTQYEMRIESDAAIVTKIEADAIYLEVKGGTVIGPVEVSQSILDLIQINDGLVVTLGRHQKIWRIIKFEFLIQYDAVPIEDANGQKLSIVSGPIPGRGRGDLH